MTAICNKLLPGNYPTSPRNSSETHIGNHTERVKGTPTFSNFKKKTQTEDSQSHMNYQLNTSTTVGMVLTGTKHSNNISPTQKNSCPTDTEDYEEENPQLTNQAHLPYHPLFNPLENHSKQAQLLAKESTAYYKERQPILCFSRHQSQ